MVRASTWIAWAGVFGLFLGDLDSRQSDATFVQDIAPILRAKCVSCHRPEGPGPFSLQTYEEAKARADLIRTVALLQKMPPVLAESDFGAFAQEARLTSLELRKIQEWVRQKTPLGPGRAALGPPPGDWPMGKPDIVLRSRGKVVVPAEGSDAIRVVEVDTSFKDAKEVVAFDLRPSAPQAARAAVLAVRPEDGANPFPATGFLDPHLVGTWALGCRPWRLPEGSSVRLEPGSRLLVRMLYHPTGKNEDGGFEIGLYFAPKEATHRPRWLTVGSRDFEIGGQTPAYAELTAGLRLPGAVRVISVLPEARSKAKNVTFTAKQGSDWNRDLLRVFRWDTRWPGAYNFDPPPLLTSGTQLEARIFYDNSNHGDASLTLSQVKALPNNPSIFFGPKETDELFWIHVQVVDFP